jgi:beta-glucosidase
MTSQLYSRLAILTAGVAAIFMTGCGSGSGQSYSSDEAFVDSILSTLSLADKVGEMTQLTLGAIGTGEAYNLSEPQHLDSAKVRKVLVDYRVGSILNCGNHEHSPEKWHEFIEVIQEAASQKSSGIPVLYGVDAIHGPTYTENGVLGPQQIGLGATWNPAVAKTAAKNTAEQVHALGIHWNFSPVLDLARDPRWPRFWETFGEDPYLVSEMGTAMVEGYQYSGVPFAATLKHFFGYGFALSGKDRTPAWIPERQMREYFLPPFAKAVEAGAMSIMVNSGEINGVPVHSSKFLLTEILRGDLGFDGVLVTDWEDIKYLFTRHMVAENYKQATKMAIDAGIDMAMVPLDLDFSNILMELVNEGEISESRLDQSVRRILMMKKKLGLFESNGLPPSLDAYPAKEKFESAAARAALESITLLKNEPKDGATVLPIMGNKKIFVTGPTSNSLNALNGGWTGTWQGTDTAYNTVGRPTMVESMVMRLGAERIEHMDLGMDFSDQEIQRVVRSIQRQRPSHVVLGLGEMPYTEIVGNIEDLELFENQKNLVKAVHATGVTVVAVFIEGRPRTFDEIEPMLDAVVMAYLPGDYGADAIAQVLDGSYNPSGRLPFTWPRHASAHLTYDHKYTEQIHVNFTLEGFNPQYEFGAGLSYSSTAFSGLKTDRVAYGMHDTIIVSVTIANTGERLTNELVAVFSQDKVASITPSVDRLRHFQRVILDAGEETVASARISVAELGFINRENKYVVEPGTFGIRVGNEIVDIDVFQKNK